MRTSARWHQLTRRGKASTTTLGAFGIAAALSLAQCAPSQCAPTPAPAPAPAPFGVVQQVVDITNARRAEHGLPALGLNGLLTNAAQAHSADQAAANTMSHTGTDGSSPGDRIARAGYRFSAWGENVAAGYPDAASVMDGWMNSAGHRANILNGTFTEIGIGLAHAANGAPYWTMELARPG